MSKSIAVFLSVTACTTGLAAQWPQGGEWLVSSGSGCNAAFIIAPNGTSRPVCAPVQSSTDVAVTPDGRMLVLDPSGPQLVRIDGPGQYLSYRSLRSLGQVAVDREGDYILLGDTTLWAPPLFRMDSWSGVMTPIPLSTTIQGAAYLALDPANGDVLIADQYASRLLRVDANGTTTTLYSSTAQEGFAGVAMFPNGDYAVIAGSTNSILRVPRGGGTPTIFCTSSAFAVPRDIASSPDGGFVVCTSGAGNANRNFLYVDARGVVTSFPTVLPSAGTVIVMPHVRGPVVGISGSTMSWSFEFAQRPSTPYLTLLSGSLYPGFAFGTSISPIQPDAIFSSLVGFNPPGMQGFTGVFDATGLATAVLAVPNVPIPAGFALHMQVGTFSPPPRFVELGMLHTVLF